MATTTKAPAKKAPAKRTPTAKTTFTEDEKKAMAEYVAETRGRAKKGNKVDGLAEIKAAIAKMTAEDGKLAQKIHDLVIAAAPHLTPKTWYGMPAYANAEGNVVCFFQNAGKFKARFSTLGFSDKAKLDDGNMWPIYYALGKLTAEDEQKIAALIKRAVG